jgi:hypothetical protein
VTEPYLFFSTGRTGLTVARQSMTPGVVAGADIRLETLNKLLSSQRVTAGSRLAVVDAAGRVVATDHDIALPPTNGVANEKVELPTLEAANFPVVRSLRSSLSHAPGDQEVASVRDDHGRKWHTAVRPLAIEVERRYFRGGDSRRRTDGRSRAPAALSGTGHGAGRAVGGAPDLHAGPPSVA